MDPTVRRIIVNARELSATDVFEGQYRLADYARAAEAEWARMDVLLLPTVPGQPTVAQVAADPIGRNAASAATRTLSTCWTIAPSRCLRDFVQTVCRLASR
jgi:Asp-tRNA(Asn)/Glu-tRNA(Gln) amidotransferase A subunit family amidase